MPIPAPTATPDTFDTRTQLPDQSAVSIEFNFSEYNQRAKYVPSETLTYNITASTTIENGPALVRCDCTTGAITVTFPTAASSVGKVLYITKVDAGANAVTLAVQSSDTLWKPATLTTLTTQHQVCGFLSTYDGTNWGWQCLTAS